MNTDLIKQVAKLAELQKQATPGPWVQWNGHPDVYAGPAEINTSGHLCGVRVKVAACEIDTEYDLMSDYDEEQGPYDGDANAAFIAAAGSLSYSEILAALSAGAALPASESYQQVGWYGPYGIVPGGMDNQPDEGWRPVFVGAALPVVAEPQPEDDWTPRRVLNRALNKRFGHDLDGPIPWGNMTPKVVYDVALEVLQACEKLMLSASKAANDARAELAAALPGSGSQADSATPEGEDPRGRWVWQPYKLTEEEKREVFKASLYPGCEVYCPMWDDSQPFAFFHEVDEDGVLMYCAPWADQTPKYYSWADLWKQLQAGMDYYRPASAPLEGSSPQKGANPEQPDFQFVECGECGDSAIIPKRDRAPYCSTCAGDKGDDVKMSVRVCRVNDKSPNDWRTA